MNQQEHLNKLTAWIARKGFVWGPSPEIYGGIAGFYDYAPLGKLLKNNVEKVIRETFTKNDFWEVECPIVTPRIVWEASGHLAGFTDPVIKCNKCGANYRADNLIKEITGEETDGLKDEELLRIIKEKEIKCPSCKKGEFQEIKRHNLMMRTTIGLDTEAYNRPETATTTYLPFNRYKTFFRDKTPFGVFQIGKAFRNEISPRQHIIRMREFTQAEGQLFILPEQKKEYQKYEEIKNKKTRIIPAKTGKEEETTYEEAHNKGYFKNKAYCWTVALAEELFKNMGIPEENIRLRQHGEDEKAFYADDAWDVEIKLKSFGWTEVCGIHDRTDYDLKQHANKSGEELTIRNEEGEKKTPHVLEIAFGVDRPVYALMDLFYGYDEKKEQEVFTIPAKMAPIKTAVFSLVKKEGLPEIAEEIHKEIKKAGIISTIDHSGSIGRRYARQDEIGTPYCITIDFQTKEDGTVTIRERDSTKQERIKKEEIIRYLKEKTE